MRKIKGVILAGGSGSRLYPATKILNKHVIPLTNIPMIYFPLRTLVDMGIRDIMIITGGEHQGTIAQLLSSGKDTEIDGTKDGRKVDLNITYRAQDTPGGIAQALRLARGFVGNEKFAMVLGDNIFEDNFKEDFQDFLHSDDECRLFLKKVPDANRFGVAEIKNGKLVGIEEKPKRPKSNYAQTGLYMYDPSVFYIIRTLKPSKRGELEIADANQEYIRRGTVGFKILKGFWSDAGTPESLHKATCFVRGKENAD